MDDVLLFQAGVGDRLLHGEKIVRRTVAHEAARTPVDRGFDVDLQAAVNLTAKTHLAIDIGGGDSRSRVAE